LRQRQQHADARPQRVAGSAQVGGEQRRGMLEEHRITAIAGQQHVGVERGGAPREIGIVDDVGPAEAQPHAGRHRVDVGLCDRYVRTEDRLEGQAEPVGGGLGEATLVAAGIDRVIVEAGADRCPGGDGARRDDGAVEPAGQLGDGDMRARRPGRGTGIDQVGTDDGGAGRSRSGREGGGRPKASVAARPSVDPHERAGRHRIDAGEGHAVADHDGPADDVGDPGPVDPEPGRRRIGDDGFRVGRHKAQA